MRLAHHLNFSQETQAALIKRNLLTTRALNECGKGIAVFRWDCAQINVYTGNLKRSC